MATIISTIQDMMTPNLLSRFASNSGLPESTVKTGLSGATASILDGLAGRADDPRTMNRVADVVSRSPDVDFDSTERVFEEGSTMHTSGTELLGLATPDSSGLTSRLASMLGIGGRSASGIVAAAASMAIAAFRRLGRSRGGFDASSLASLLQSERREIHAAVPSGLSAIDSVAMPRRTERIRERVYDRRHPEQVVGPHKRNWMWVLGLIPLVLLGFWLFNRKPHKRVANAPVTAPLVREPTVEKPTMPDRVVTPEERPVTPQARPVTPQTRPTQEAQPTTPQAEPTTPEAQPTTPEAQPTMPEERPATPDERPVAPSAPAETAMTFPPGSVESRLLAHVQSPTGKDAATWFELDSITFATGKSDIADTGSEQLANVASIMKANPNVKFQIGGYTDATGSRKINKKLSEARAEAVKTALVANGVDADQVDTKGYGEAHKIEETKGSSEANRRVAIRVVKR